MSSQARIFAAAVLGVLLFGCAKEAPQGSPKETALTAAEAKALAQEAYVFGLPPVYISVQSDQLSNVPSPEGARAPFNQFAHYRQFPDAKNNPIVGMNVDTLYSIANLDLKPEPMVLSIPQMGDRYWMMQIIDAWNEVPATPSARTVGGKGGNFVLIGPNWKGDIPQGLTEIRSATSLTMIGGRTYTTGKSEYMAVHKLQDQYRLVPLSKWGSDYAPPATVTVKPKVDAKTPVPEQVFAMTPEVYFARLNALLVDNPPHADDAPLMARVAKLGIAPGATFTMESFSEEVRKAIGEGVLAGQNEIKEWHAKMGQKVNGWQLARDLGKYGTNYPYRAAWTYYGVGGNLVEDAVYPTTQEDSGGNPITGDNRYQLHFNKDQIPPVDAFWSLTMYDADSYLVDNPINRYAIRGSDKMKYGNDGSLTLYIQHDSPGAAKQANWLPAPKGRAFLALRLYRPRAEVANGNWNPPAVEKVQ